MSVDVSGQQNALLLSGELDAEVADQYRAIRKEVENALNHALGDQDYGDVLNEIGIIPIILGPRFSEGRTERRLVKRAEKTADYRLFIDYKDWAAGSQGDRKRLLVKNVLACVKDIDRKLKGTSTQNASRRTFVGFFQRWNLTTNPVLVPTGRQRGAIFSAIVDRGTTRR